MSITWHGIEEFAGDLDRFAGDLDSLPEQDKAGELIRSAAAAGAPHRTGRLAGSVTVQSRSGTVFVVAKADYAPPVVAGVPSHNLRPRPFIDRALAAREGEVLALLERGVEREASKI